MERVTKNVSVLSKITVRAKASVRGAAPVAAAATTPPTGPRTRRPNHHTNTRVASVKRSEGSRAASSVGPRTSMTTAPTEK